MTFATSGIPLRCPRGYAHVHFHDRAGAGAALALPLEVYRGADTLVLGLPRGGVVVADAIARALDAPLDIVVARKIGAPHQPELALGAVAEGDHVYWDEQTLALGGTDAGDLAPALERAQAELRERLACYRTVQAQVPRAGRTVIVADDGMATGSTLRAAIHAVRADGPRCIVVALPGGPREGLIEIARMPAIREVVALAAPVVFHSVSQIYDDFEQVTTEQVCEILRRAADRRPASSGTATK